MHSVTTARRATCLSQRCPGLPEPATPCSSPLGTDSQTPRTWIFTLNLQIIDGGTKLEGPNVPKPHALSLPPRGHRPSRKNTGKITTISPQACSMHAACADLPRG